MDTGEGMCYGECCEMCKTDDSQTCTPGTNNTLYVNLKNQDKNQGKRNREGEGLFKKFLFFY